MRKHGWQLPYHPLQVVAVAVFLALGFAFYVFFAPFVGKKLYQYIAMGVYTPLIVCVFGLYVWCAAADPADPGVFKSKKYLKTSGKGKDCKSVESKVGGDSVSSLCDPSAPEKGGRSMHQEGKSKDGHAEDSEPESEAAKTSLPCTSWFMGLLMLPFAFLCGCRSPWDESSERHMSEDGMFYCSLCEVEVFKYSKHCRVCDKCVDSFDHHCRWLNNCIGKTNYRRFFTLMIFSLLLLVLQWLTGILVLICCFLDRKRFSVDIVSKLGSSFTIVPFVIVVVVCTILAMLATLPIAQLFFFHILLIKKGISTYDYIIALREQEQQVGGGQQSPQMSQVSSLTGMSSASSFNTFHRGAWCTPPRLFVEDQYDVVPPETASVSSYGKKTTTEEPPPFKKKNPAVKISPWALARLNAEEVSKAAAEARKKSKILQPIARRDKGGSARLPHQLAIPGQDTDSSLGSSGRRMTGMTKLGSSSSRRRNNNGGSNHNKRVIRIPQEIGSHKLGPGSGSSRVLMGRSYGNNSNIAPSIPAKSGIITASSASLVPLRLEGRSTFRSSLQAPMSSSANMMVGSSPESSLDSPDIHPFGVSSSRIEESRRLAGLGVGGGGTSSGTLITGLPRSRSTSDGYEASGGEDSDRVPSSAATNGGGVQGPVNWDSLLLGSGSRDARIMGKVKTSSAGMRKH